VDGDDRLQPGLGIAAEDDLFVTGAQYIHARSVDLGRPVARPE
jgi:hypothetical protein